MSSSVNPVSRLKLAAASIMAGNKRQSPDSQATFFEVINPPIVKPIRSKKGRIIPQLINLTNDNSQ
jgi:hypothetical protein